MSLERQNIISEIWLPRALRFVQFLLRLSLSLFASRAAETPRGPRDVISWRNGDNKNTGRVSLPLKKKSVASFNKVECYKPLFRQKKERLKRLKSDNRRLQGRRCNVMTWETSCCENVEGSCHCLAKSMQPGFSCIPPTPPPPTKIIFPRFQKFYLVSYKLYDGKRQLRVDRRVWTGFIWLRIGTSGEILCTQ
jgi:hypothetical protein